MTVKSIGMDGPVIRSVWTGKRDELERHARRSHAGNRAACNEKKFVPLNYGERS